MWKAGKYPCGYYSCLSRPDGQMDVSLWSHGVMRLVFFSSRFSPQGQFIIEGMVCLCHIAMDIWYSHLIHLCAVSLHVSCLHPISHLLCSFLLFLATSSAQLEDLSFLNNQRAAGHRGSVRKHNTAGRPSDDIKGILRLNVEVRSMYKYSFGAETPTAPYQNYHHHLFNVFLPDVTLLNHKLYRCAWLSLDEQVLTATSV